MTDTAYTYDSARGRRPLLSDVSNLREYRGLLRLLVVRDLTVRYKRSVLGIWWTLLNPLLFSGVIWVVFGQIFRFETPGVPYIVYLLSGVIWMGFFSQGVMTTGSAIVNSASILTKVSVPPEIFSFAAAIAAGANFVLSLPILIAAQLAFGVGVPWTVVLVPIPLIATVVLVTGIGLLVASAAVFFFDVLDFTAVLVQLASYLTPTFYPIEIIPEHLRWLVALNPLYSYLEVFRGFMYGGTFAPAWQFAVMIGTAVLAFLIGVWVFSRSWKNLVVRI
ncbi:MAG: ABC transporter permease [Acidimicrobiia bacterium]|nr:ABC transporter permease [Acidimicrobiia bacterium]